MIKSYKELVEENQILRNMVEERQDALYRLSEEYLLLRMQLAEEEYLRYDQFFSIGLN